MKQFIAGHCFRKDPPMGPEQSWASNLDQVGETLEAACDWAGK